MRRPRQRAETEDYELVAELLEKTACDLPSSLTQNENGAHYHRVVNRGRSSPTRTPFVPCGFRRSCTCKRAETTGAGRDAVPASALDAPFSFSHTMVSSCLERPLPRADPCHGPNQWVFRIERRRPSQLTVAGQSGLIDSSNALRGWPSASSSCNRCGVRRCRVGGLLDRTGDAVGDDVFACRARHVHGIIHRHRDPSLRLADRVPAVHRLACSPGPRQ